MKNQHKFIPFLLYCIPIIFFIVSYFLITTSCEDIYQGANSYMSGVDIDIMDDAKNAFNHSGRITDMYAWTVIDFFNYQFQFGVDTIFRLLDVALASSAIYLATYVVLGRKPHLETKDSLVFCAIFSAIVFSMFGRRLYSEFSMIHNYVPVVLITLLLCIPYLKFALKKPVSSSHHLLTITLILLGFLFGMSSTITSLTFLVTVLSCTLVRRKSLSKIPAWYYTGLIGLVIGFCISFFLSPGMNSYATDPSTAETFDYISVSDVFSNPTSAIPRLLFHLAYNSSLVLLSLLPIFLIAVFSSKKTRQVFTKHPFKNLPADTKHLILIFAIFICFHFIATIQIKSPPRILIPAYIAGVILIFKIFYPYIKSKIINSAIVFFSVLAVVLHAMFLSIYHAQSAEILDEIKNSPEDSLCIERSRVEAPRLPVINLSQEFIINDWGYPEPIYGKDVTFCPPK